MLPSELERFVAEDIGEWDLSSSIVTDINARAVLLAKEDCIISGLSEAGEILGYFGLDAEQLYNDGEFVSSGSVIMIVQGSSRKILQAERLVLNFLARMSGISTLTRDVRPTCQWGESCSHAQDHTRVQDLREACGIFWRWRSTPVQPL